MDITFSSYVRGAPENSGIYLGSLDGGDPKRPAAAETAGADLAPGMIVFMRQTALLAQHIDVKRGELTGDPITIADPVGSTVNNFGEISVSTEGAVAYRAGKAGPRELTWYDRAGKATGTVGEPDPDFLLHPEISPDGKQVAVQRTSLINGENNNTDVWLKDLASGVLSRFTSNTAADNFPVCSPDGARIAFASNRRAFSFDLYTKSTSGSGGEELLLETQRLSDWSRDGRSLLYSRADPKTGSDLWALPMTGPDRQPMPIANTRFDERNAQFSPDGRFVAYETRESGRFEVVVQSFPVPSGTRPVSTSGGMQPLVRADGREIYFIAPDGRLMAAPVTISGTTFAAGAPTALFATRLPANAANRLPSAVSRDGRFLVNQQTETVSAPITLLMSWKLK